MHYWYHLRQGISPYSLLILNLLAASEVLLNEYESHRSHPRHSDNFDSFRHLDPNSLWGRPGVPEISSLPHQGFSLYSLLGDGLQKKRYHVESDDSELEELGLVEKGVEEFVNVLPPEEDHEEEIQMEDSSSPTRAPHSILKKPKPFDSTSSYQRKMRMGLSEIHASQFSSSRRSSR